MAPSVLAVECLPPPNQRAYHCPLDQLFNDPVLSHQWDKPCCDSLISCLLILGSPFVPVPSGDPVKKAIVGFEENKTAGKVGEKIGFVFSYFLFTTILFFILLLLKKLPESWNYLHIMGIVLIITLIGASIKRLLE